MGLPALLIGFFCLAALNAGFCNGGCIERERQALLKLKQDMVDPAHLLASWVADDEDCCRWKRVVCDNVTSHILELHLRTPPLDYDLARIQYEANGGFLQLGGKISPSLRHLKHLRYLDLSDNGFGIQIPNFIGSLRSLRLLNLSNSGFVGEVPHHIGNLSNLKHLDLNGNNYLQVEDFRWLSSLSSLEFLDMSWVNLVKVSNWPHMISALPSLVELHLSSCNLGPHDEVHPITNINLSSLDVLDLSHNPGLVNFSNINWVFGLRKLIFLDLSWTNFAHSIPYYLQNLTVLRHLDLSYNSFNSLVPNWLDNFSHLEFLDLSYNNFEGEIPIRSIGKLCNLRFLSFTDVNLTLQTSHILEIFSGCVSNSLESLHLESCQLSGQLTSRLGNFKIMKELDLSSNSISGPIPMSIGELQCLKVLYLSSNKLNGSLPKSFGQLANLEDIDISLNSFEGSLPKSFGQLSNLKYVDISQNSFEGIVSEIHFVSLTKLNTFIADGNSLMILRVNPNWVPHFQIFELRLASWHLGLQFPQWLHSQKYLRYLDISNTRISDMVPSWFWGVSSQCVYVNISHNQIHGQLPNVLNSSPTFFGTVIDFNSNNFTGPLARISSNVVSLDMSNNNLSGSLFHFLCGEMNEFMTMNILNLGKNFLFGELPDCWTNWQYLNAIVLADNQLTGGIPRSIGALGALSSLHLQENYLTGEIPLSLSNCTNLEILQLRENELDGSIPPWMGHSLSNLKILDLGSNKFSGHIPNDLCLLNSLQILSLAQNNLSGSLPRCIGNISVLLSTNSHSHEFFSGYGSSDGYFHSEFSYQDATFVSIKGQWLEYDKTLYLVKIMDFSGNNLSGEIPSEVTNLQGLQSLNLSHNFFIGRIPKEIGNMRMLESVDFSGNNLSGSIPESMSNLTFLSYLNLSNNQLVGRIPLGTQLQGFNPSNFAGNKQLCGLPLADNCSCINGNCGPSIETRGRKHRNGVEINWFFVSMTLGFIVGFWSVLSPLVISRRWRCMYYQFLEEMWWKISAFISKYF
ncbi:hypothetical protein SLEP1_g38180 [Rubroshorea leprosula]|uniref:Leucine-rich repeat-containing N-terminal plant-type domain-containing protein n=1 Tax=Rubroshorea leprosula TaxID=152421 RepID=A0AAV5KX43_9ROSI|nr:hypothetical protein SLEP1_g38180 [Rubroshorea leprosula]